MCYRAPEQLALLPRDIKTKYSNTFAIDLWALGVVVHEMLTSKLPFMDADADADTDVETPIPTNDQAKNAIPKIGKGLVGKYCCGLIPFPSESFEKNGVSETGCNFVKSLMAADPKNRVSAPEALEDKWLKEVNPRTMERELLKHELEVLSIRVDAEFVNLLFAEEDLTRITEILLSGIGKLKIRDLLCRSVAMGHLQFVNLMLPVVHNSNAGAGVEKQLLLRMAALNCQVGVMKVLLDHGTDVDSAPPDGKSLFVSRGQTALQIVAKTGDLHAIDLLLSYGADVNAPSSQFGMTAFQAAAHGGHVEAMGVLLEHGADINAPASRNGMTALQAASEGGHLKAMEFLITQGADVDEVPASYSGMTALQAAAKGGHLDAARLLLLKGATADWVSLTFAKKNPEMSELISNYRRNQNPLLFGQYSPPPPLSHGL